MHVFVCPRGRVSPHSGFCGLCSKRGPHRPMSRAPIGAVKRMDSTATVSTFIPYCCICSFCLQCAMSRVVEPIAACRERQFQLMMYYNGYSGLRNNFQTLKKNSFFFFLNIDPCSPIEMNTFAVCHFYSFGPIFSVSSRYNTVLSVHECSHSSF